MEAGRAQVRSYSRDRVVVGAHPVRDGDTLHIQASTRRDDFPVR